MRAQNDQRASGEPMIAQAAQASTILENAIKRAVGSAWCVLITDQRPLDLSARTWAESSCHLSGWAGSTPVDVYVITGLTLDQVLGAADEFCLPAVFCSGNEVGAVLVDLGIVEAIAPNEVHEALEEALGTSLVLTEDGTTSQTVERSQTRMADDRWTPA